MSASGFDEIAVKAVAAKSKNRLIARGPGRRSGYAASPRMNRARFTLGSASARATGFRPPNRRGSSAIVSFSETPRPAKRAAVADEVLALRAAGLVVEGVVDLVELGLALEAPVAGCSGIAERTARRGSAASQTSPSSVPLKT